jgi:A-factor biosynthesis hotdog domain
VSGGRRRVLVAPVTVGPTKPLTPTHLKYLLSLDVLHRATATFADVTFLYQHASYHDSQQITGFWSYLDDCHPGRDYTDTSEEEIGELYATYHRERADRPVELRPRADGPHPVTARLLDIWADHYRTLGMVDPAMGRDGPPLADTDDVLALLSDRQLCVDGRGLGAPVYLDATEAGLPLRVVIGADGRPNYLMPLLREVVPQLAAHDLVVLAHDVELRTDYRTVAHVLTALGATVVRFEVPRVPLDGIASSTRHGGWQGYTVGAFAGPLIEAHGLDAFRFGMRLYLVAGLGQTARDSFSLGQLRRWVRRAGRLLDRHAGDPSATCRDLGSYLAVRAGARGYADPYRVITTLLCRDGDVPTDELLHLVTAAPPAAGELSFSRTVPRTSVHRHNITEVFLTDVRTRDVRTRGPAPAHRFAAAALLPVVHPHYTAHTGAANRRLDPMLLLECCRQAETYAAHAFYGVDDDTAFVLKGWSLSLRPGTFAPRTNGGGPVELVVDARTSGLRSVGGAARGLIQDFDLRAFDRPVAHARIEVAYLPQPAYAVLRMRGRQTPPPSSADCPLPTGIPVAPRRVGRIAATDTLLLDLFGTGDAVTAILRVPTDNPSLYDHPQDHVPGTVLVEAARQLAAVVTHRRRGAAPDRTVMTMMTASFRAYAELDAPIVLSARPVDGVDRPTATQPVTVNVTQAGARVASIRIGMSEPTTPTGWGVRRWAVQPS